MSRTTEMNGLCMCIKIRAVIDQKTLRMLEIQRFQLHVLYNQVKPEIVQSAFFVFSSFEPWLLEDIPNLQTTSKNNH